METNRPYISFSQYALFISSPKAYYNKYVLDKATHSTKYQKFGKKLMEDLEFGNIVGVPKRLNELVHSGFVEYEITASVKFMKKDLFGILDVITNNKNKFIEIKTGKIPWNKSKVLKDKQMLFYALMINLKYNIIPTATLIWAETMEDNDGDIFFTGQIKEFKREFTLEELDKFLLELVSIAKEIEDYEHTVIDVGADRDAKLLELITEKKRIDDELDLLKAEIMLDIKDFDSNYAQSENFNITLAERKTYTYSEGLNDKIKAQNEEIKIMKSQQVKNGTAKVKITEYLLIKAKK